MKNTTVVQSAMIAAIGIREVEEGFSPVIVLMSCDVEELSSYEELSFNTLINTNQITKNVITHESVYDSAVAAFGSVVDYVDLNFQHVLLDVPLFDITLQTVVDTYNADELQEEFEALVDSEDTEFDEADLSPNRIVH
jgi:hypothetical protein